MREKFIKVEGGKRLEGEVNISGAKNSAGHLLVAAMLTDEECIIHNVPDIQDTDITVGLLRECGVGVDRVNNDTYRVRARSVGRSRVESVFGSESRAPAIFLGALAARCGEVRILQPGGDRIGRRPLDRHLKALASLGYKVGFDGEYYFAKADKLSGSIVSFAKNTHMGTDNVILASCLIPDTTVIENAAEEPEVDDMIGFLNSMGATILRTGKREIVINGVNKLRGSEFWAIPDRNEAVTYGVAALITRGDLFLRNARSKHIEAFLEKVEEMGGEFSRDVSGVRIKAKRDLRAVDIVTSCHPGFMTDWQPQITALLTQAVGASTVVERIHSNRFQFIDELIAMGGSFRLFNPDIEDPSNFYDFDISESGGAYHGCDVIGPRLLKGAEVGVTDIRAGGALILAALCAEGNSTIRGISHIERGYERFVEKLSNVGAVINEVEYG